MEVFKKKYDKAKETYSDIKDGVGDIRQGANTVKNIKDNLVENKEKYVFGAACLAAGFLLGSKTSRPVVSKTYVVLNPTAP